MTHTNSKHESNAIIHHKLLFINPSNDLTTTSIRSNPFELILQWQRTVCV